MGRVAIWIEFQLYKKIIVIHVNINIEIGGFGYGMFQIFINCHCFWLVYFPAYYKYLNMNSGKFLKLGKANITIQEGDKTA